VELVAKIVALVKARRGLKIVYVPGHAGVAGNERADELARTAVSSRGVKKLDLGEASP
jgi:ribonuclease HI